MKLEVCGQVGRDKKLESGRRKMCKRRLIEKLITF